MKEIIHQLNSLQRDTLQRITEYLAGEALEGAGRSVSIDKMDRNQLVHYNLAYQTAECYISDHFQDYAWGENCTRLEQTMALIFAGEALNRLRSEIAARREEYGLSQEELTKLFSSETNAMVGKALAAPLYDYVAEQALEGKFGTLGFSENLSMIQETFRQFSNDVVAPCAEEVHRNDTFIPDKVLDGLMEIGALGINIPAKYGGFLDDYGTSGMMIVTEELSRGGLAIAGSMVTRPEILCKALLKGGTEEQKERFLPALASGQRMCAIAVTEPNHGSDVAGIKVTADAVENGWLINGVKTWCTLAGYADLLTILARTEKDRTLKHKGLSMLIAEKPRDKGHKFSFTQENGGTVSGSAIATVGYRGMHSFELHFDNYFVPAKNLVGEKEGRGKGFYLQMVGFAGGRAQTAARANGVMQAALEAACRYASERRVFNKEIAHFQLTRWKIARMATIVQASRQYSLHVAKLMDRNEGGMEASLIKFYASRISEWVTREAMQIHGGMGYAEEYAVSRYFLDSRVFSIFEGAEEVMALRVCARELLNRQLASL